VEFTHFHNHHPIQPSHPSYDIQIQIDLGSGFVDIGSSLNISNANYAATDILPFHVDLLPGTYRLRKDPRDLSGAHSGGDFFAVNDVTLYGRVIP